MPPRYCSQASLMRYLGGKSKTAKMIAGVIQPRGLWWEPFCGGLSVSVQLAAYGSFSGMWFRSTAVAALRLWSPRDKGWLLNDPVGAARRSLLRDVPRLAGCEIKCLDFLTCDPPEVEVIYCDPPYEGTAGYKAVGPFDHKAFWRRCQALAQRSRVFVSEYACPVPHEEVWSRPSGCIVSRSGSGLDPRAPKRSNRVERLFGVLPL